MTFATFHVAFTPGCRPGAGHCVRPSAPFGQRLHHGQPAPPRRRITVQRGRETLESSRHARVGGRQPPIIEVASQHQRSRDQRLRTGADAQLVEVGLYRSLDTPRRRRWRGRAVIWLYGFDQRQRRGLGLLGLDAAIAGTQRALVLPRLAPARLTAALVSGRMSVSGCRSHLLLTHHAQLSQTNSERPRLVAEL
jgi:hypothetical protein